MKSICCYFFLFIFCLQPLVAQEKTDVVLPYQQINEAPEQYNAGAILSRMVDGLGFRYYWATDSLRETDLDFRPTPEARSTGETIEHVYSLSLMILSVALEKGFERPTAEELAVGYDALRRLSLTNFAQASTLFRAASDEQVAAYKIRFGSSPNEVPLWNLINGPIADAIYHTGQIVSFRRMSGNPIHPGVNVFRGKTKL